MNDLANEAALMEVSRIQRGPAGPVITHEGFSFPCRYDVWQPHDEAAEHYRKAREAVRLSLSFDRQREQHAIYLNQDHVDYLKQCAADARVDAREHIRLAKKAEGRLS